MGRIGAGREDERRRGDEEGETERDDSYAWRHIELLRERHTGTCREGEGKQKEIKYRERARKEREWVGREGRRQVERGRGQLLVII